MTDMLIHVDSYLLGYCATSSGKQLPFFPSYYAAPKRPEQVTYLPVDDEQRSKTPSLHVCRVKLGF
jgi:hypothetical protein